MKNIIMVSRCTGTKPHNSEESIYSFHYQGVFGGDPLGRVELRGRKDYGIKKGTEYLLYVQMLAIEDGVLMGKILRVKPLGDCWDKGD